MRVFTAILVFLPTIIAVHIDQFVPFGTEHGDTGFPVRSRDYHIAQFPFGIPVFDYKYENVAIFSNGVVRFRVYGAEIKAFKVFVKTDGNDTGMIFYRQVVSEESLLNLAATLSPAYHMATDLILKSALVVTWHNVRPYLDEINQDFCNGNGSKRNTFQLVLTTDGALTFAIFNYGKIEWFEWTDCRGKSKYFAKIGYEFGSNSLTLKTTKVPTVMQRSNVGVPGRFIFRIGSICHIDRHKSYRLDVFPDIVDPLSHQIVTLIGPCLKYSANLRCVFKDMGDVEVRGTLKGDSQAECEIPYLATTGDIIRVELKFENATQHTNVYVGDLEIAELLATVNIRLDDQMTILWSKNAFEGEENVKIVLLGFGAFSKRKNKWSERLTITSNTANTGRITVNRLHTLSAKDLNFVFVVVVQSLVNPKSQISRFYELIEFLFRPSGQGQFATVNHHLKRIADNRCERWHKSNSSATQETFLDCPFTVQEARGQVNSSYSFKVGITFGYESYSYWYTERHVEYYKIVNCVYNHDGHLLTATEASCLLSNAQKFLPYIWCCKLNDSSKCDKYYGRHDFDNILTTYRLRRQGRANGNGHIATLDGVEYTFNGAGEFWMLKNSTVESKTVLVQSRAEIYGANEKATVFTSFVFFYPPDSCKIEVSLSETDRLKVWLNGTLFNATSRIKTVGETKIDASLPSAVTLFFPGFLFLVGANHSALYFVAFVGGELFGESEGLLGKLDGSSLNDLSTPEGTIIPIGSNLTQIHYEFGTKWAITENESLFSYRKDTSFATYNRSDFIPIFSYQLKDIPFSAFVACEPSDECLFDYAATEDLTFAGMTKLFIELLKKDLIICGKTAASVSLRSLTFTPTVRFNCFLTDPMHESDRAKILD